MGYTHLVKPGSKVNLRDIDPDDTGPFKSKDDPAALAQLEADIDRLVDLQARLYAESKRSLLIVLQAMDTGGKDGTIKQVVGPLDSRGCYVHSFKAPNSEEASHDFLWRLHQKCPRRGEIVIFNRSHYEEVLVVRVLGLKPKSRWSRYYDHINAFEQMLADEGTKIVKLFLHISKDEQRRRLEERLTDPKKLWKFDLNDVEMRRHWGDFEEAYEALLGRCSTEAAPWHIVPANAKWFRNIAVARALVEALEDIDPRYPEAQVDPSAIDLD